MLQLWSITWRLLWQRFACPVIGACLLLGGPLLAQPSAPPHPDLLTPQERGWLATHPIIRLWPDPWYQPIDFLDERGQHQGLSAEYLALIAQRLGLHYQVTHISSLHNKLNLKQPETILGDFNTALTPTPSRNENWAFTKPYLEFPAYFIARNTAREGLTPEMLAGSRVAVIEDYAAREYLATKYPQLSLDLVPDTQTGLRKVSFGLVDVFVSDLPVATYWMEREGISNLKIVGETGYVYQLCLAARKDWPEFISILDKGLATITPEERVAIYRKWVKMPAEVSGVSRRLWWGVLGGLGVAGVGLLLVFGWNRTLSVQVKQRTAALQQELNERKLAEERFRKIFRSSPNALAIARFADGLMLDVNDSWVQMSGYAKEDFIGRRADETELWHKGKRRDELIRALVQHRRLHNWEVEYQTKTGDRRIGNLSIEVLRLNGELCHLWSVLDLTDRKRAEEALQESEALFRSLTESTGAWVFIVQDLLFCYVNAAAEVGIGYAREELIGQELWSLIVPEDRPIIEERVHRRRQGLSLTPSYEIRVMTKSGEVRWLQNTSKIIPYNNGVADLSTAFDITDRKQAEEQRKISEQQLHQLAGYLQTVREEERTAMAREIHDELGQALTAMKIDLVRLNNVLPTPTAPAQERLNGLLELINATINTVRKLASQLRPGVLDDLGLAAALEWQAQEFQIRTDIACEFVELSETANVGTEQATAIFRICQEALTNVARHAQATRVTICLQETPTHLRLEVKDNGCGVTAGELANPRSLGLLGMRERAFLLGGDCQLTGAVNAGTTVTVQIPLRQTKAQGGA